MRYIGNKTRMLERINEFIEDEKIKGETFCDIFAGTSSVGDNFKGKYKIIANDFLYFSSIIAKGRLYNSDIPKFKTFQTEKTKVFLSEREKVFKAQPVYHGKQTSKKCEKKELFVAEK